ncbi:alcohol dehydrogenase [Mycena alexandri]|uniref:Alcohol dehydrogenase n=1 Tax=Mycena alexandri TaxID=1745969 RepID=A0AAD6SWK8_9AGAR|nr:alcohol dehydrogenase [Mycena alexandri]
MTPANYKRIVLNSRPEGEIEPTTFRTETLPLDLKPGVDEVLVQVTWMSLDPAMRSYIREQGSYMAPVKIGDVMRAHGLGVVVQAGSQSTQPVGQLVVGSFGWTEFALMKATEVQAITVPKGVQPLDFLNTLGISGLSAYFGLKKVCDLKPGEKLVVSGAAGSVGSVACQLGKQAGAIVYAIAGSQDKCDWLEKELGADKAFNYKSPTFVEDFKEVGNIDVYFDNVGGDILDLVLSQLNKGARIALCGAISQYNASKPKGLHNYLSLISQRAKIEGFLIFDYVAEFPAAREEMTRGLLDGSIKGKFHVVEGLDQAPVALPMLFSGGNTGKLVVKISEEPKL